MKNILVSVLLLAAIQSPSKELPPAPTAPLPTSGNLIIITIDGLRWQEIFTGADTLLLNDESETPDPSTINILYGGNNGIERRQKLMPFFWSLIAQKGQVYGNRLLDNKVNVANAYAISYPGYNEILTGTTDPNVATNRKYHNPNINVLEYLNAKPGFNGKVAAFSSWDVFPYILNEKRNGLPINSGYEPAATNSSTQTIANRVQEEAIEEKSGTRYDQLTFITAKEYLQKHSPRVLFLGLGETDEFAHDGRYDLYLQQAHSIDQMISELWHWIQTTPGYKNNTTILITTDHGRGSRKSKWSSHGSLIRGSSETWLAVIGPGIAPLGEMQDNQQWYQQQLAQTIAGLLGEKFEPGQPIASAIPLPALESSELVVRSSELTRK
jgi:hypothetical protein